MKTILISFSIICCTIILNAQIPNGGFENWTNENEPEFWQTNNLPSAWITVSRSSNAYSGSYAAKVEIADYSGFPVPPVLNSTFAVTQYSDVLSGYYQFYPVGNEVVLSVNAYYYKDGLPSGRGSIDIENPASSYTQFSFDPSGGYTGPADTLWIHIEMMSNSSTNPGIGSYALIDQLSLGGASDVEQINQTPTDYSLKQNYPNPFNPSTVIEFSIPQESFVELKVFNVLGKEVSTLVNDNYSAGNYKIDFRAKNLPSGMYIARISAGNFVQTKKMILLR